MPGGIVQILKELIPLWIILPLALMVLQQNLFRSSRWRGKLPPPLSEIVEDLTPDEEKDRYWLELKVERVFYEGGYGLRELRDRRLYRSSHKTFEQYCKDRFGFGRAHSYRLIDAANVVDNLSPISEMSPIRRQILPTKLEQVKPLIPLPADKQREIWQQAVDKTHGKVPSGKIVQSIVDQDKKPSKLPNTNQFTPNNVFQISCKSKKTTAAAGDRNVNLSKYDGCWAIATYAGTFTLEVEVYDGILKQVRPDNLTPIDSPQECRQIVAIQARVKKLREHGLLDRAAYYVLEGLGRQTYLTELEDELLTFLEKKYEIKVSNN